MQGTAEHLSTDIPSYLTPVFQEVDATVTRLANKKFLMDPIVTERDSRITSIVSSAYKRHGAIIERAFVAALSNCADLEVWTEPAFRVSAAADRLADSDAMATGSSLPYITNSYERTLQVDLPVYDRRTMRLGSYECKRGFGYHDSGKKRSMLRDLRCTQMLLRSYGENHGLVVNAAEAKIIFYYGNCSLGPPWALTGSDLDEHFGLPVAASIELVNNYFKAKLNDLLASA